MNDASSDGSSDGSASSDASSSEDEPPEPRAEPEVKVEPEKGMKWNLSVFLPLEGLQKSPSEPLSHEPVETARNEENDEEEDGEIQTPPSDQYQNENSNSSIPDNKSDVSQEALEDHSMPPPARVKSPSNSSDKTLDTDVHTVLDLIMNKFPTVQPISSISDSDDNIDSIITGTERPKKKRRKKCPRSEVDGGGNSSSDESSRFSEKSRRRSSLDEKKPIRGRPKNNSLSIPQPPQQQPQPPPHNGPQYDATNSSDTNSTNGTKKTHKSPRKEPQSRKTTATNRRRSISTKKSRETIPSSDGSSDENEPPKPPKLMKKEATMPVKKAPRKKPPKLSPAKIESPIASSSDSETEQRPKHSQYQSPAPRITTSSSENSDSDGSSRSSNEVNKNNNNNKKIGKNVSDKNKNDTLRKLFNVTKVSEGGKGGKGGAKGKGQVVVITPDEANQSQSKSNDSNASSSNCGLSVQNPKYLSPSSAFNTATPSVIVRIDLARIDFSRLQIPAEKLKNVPVIRTKSPAVPKVSKKRRRSSNHDEQDRWRHHNNSNSSNTKPYDQLSVSSSSSSSSSSAASTSDHQIENPAQRNASYTTNYTNDQLNNNIDHKAKDMNSFYHSPSSVDTKLPKIKRETNYQKQNFLKLPPNDFKNRIKQEPKQEEIDVAQDMRKRSSSMTNNSHNSFKEKKRKSRPDGTNDNSLPLPPTNHERLPCNGLANGDLTKQEVVKKVFFSYFESKSDEMEQAEKR